MSKKLLGIIISGRVDKNYIDFNKKLNSYHFAHKAFNLTEFVQIDKVDVITPSELFYEQKLRNIKYFQTDTEGYDSAILKALWKYLYFLPKEFYPNRIVFESNQLTSFTETMEVIDLFTCIGYSVIQIGENDSVLQYSRKSFDNLILNLPEQPPLDDPSIH